MSGNGNGEPKMDLAKRGWSDLDLTNPGDAAGIFVQSKMFKDAETTSQAMVKITAGRELGMQPFESMQALDLVEGKLRWTSHALAAKVKESSRYDYRVLDWDDNVCKIEFRERTEPGQKWADMDHLGYGYFDDAMREQAGLSKKTQRNYASNWGKHPRAMMFARAMSQGVNAHCPDVTGCIRVYTEGDGFGAQGAGMLPVDEPTGLDAALESAPEVIEVEVVPEKEPPKKKKAASKKKAAKPPEAKKKEEPPVEVEAEVVEEEPEEKAPDPEPEPEAVEAPEPEEEETPEADGTPEEDDWVGGLFGGN